MADPNSSIIVECGSCGAKNRIPAKKQHLKPSCGKCGENLSLISKAIPVGLGDHDFQQFISSVSQPILVDFFAPTCGPCKMLAPVLNRIAREYSARLIVVTVDTSSHPGTAMHYDIRGVPTLLFMKEGEVKDQIVGAPDEAVLVGKLDRFIRAN
ncbi:MAG: thioredoxin [Desulfobulbaceae bacterium]|nr:MAG: thioredoxin [Desulfobulbaceae bacterium]